MPPLLVYRIAAVAGGKWGHIYPSTTSNGGGGGGGGGGSATVTRHYTTDAALGDALRPTGPNQVGVALGDDQGDSDLVIGVAAADVASGADGPVLPFGSVFSYPIYMGTVQRLYRDALGKLIPRSGIADGKFTLLMGVSDGRWLYMRTEGEFPKV